MKHNRCERCDKPTLGFVMSMFDNAMICSVCKENEQRHPDYEKAKRAELSAVAQGDFNFPGIGLPDDLKKK